LLLERKLAALAAQLETKVTPGRPRNGHSGRRIVVPCVHPPPPPSDSHHRRGPMPAVPWVWQEAQLNEVLAASNLDPTALAVVTQKLEVRETGPLPRLSAAACVPCVVRQLTLGPPGCAGWKECRHPRPGV
jgi:hypothetical protein